MSCCWRILMAARITSTVTLAAAANSSTVWPFKSISGNSSVSKFCAYGCRLGCEESQNLDRKTLNSLLPARSYFRLDKLDRVKFSIGTLASLKTAEFDTWVGRWKKAEDCLPPEMALSASKPHWPVDSWKSMKNYWFVKSVQGKVLNAAAILNVKCNVS